jgi:hypothetical protein
VLAGPIANASDVVRLAIGGVLVTALILASGESARAEEASTPTNTVASTGGVATATGEANVTTGDIVTGFNTGHSVETGGATNGDVIVTVAEMGSAADLAVVAEVGSQIADASGGDGGEAASTPPNLPDVDVDIDNSDKNRNDNRSDATGIGEGGEGGEGGDGGDVIINPPADGEENQ